MKLNLLLILIGGKFQDDSISGIVEVADNHSFMRQILKFFMYFEIFHQQKKFINVERTYNLITLKKITPEELYDKKVRTFYFFKFLS